VAVSMTFLELEIYGAIQIFKNAWVPHYMQKKPSTTLVSVITKSKTRTIDIHAYLKGQCVQ
jgi:hypothetical protein